MNWSTMNEVSWIKLGLGILFLGCLATMPYGYFQFVRLVGMLGFAYLAYTEKDNSKKVMFFFFICSAVLINPIFKISLGRSLWNVVDIIWAALLLWDVYKTHRK
jgi:hypothetical protein